MRCVVVTDATAMKAAKGKDAIAFVKDLASRNTDKLVFNGVKFFSDDSFLSERENSRYQDLGDGLGRDGISR